MRLSSIRPVLCPSQLREGHTVGKRIDQLLVAAGLKEPRLTPFAPRNVRVTIAGLVVHVVVLADPVRPLRYVAYGPTAMGEFEDVPVVWAELHPETTLEVAITVDTAGQFRFAPMPAVVERPVRVRTA